jgi:hypothetical protein
VNATLSIIGHVLRVESYHQQVCLSGSRLAVQYCSVSKTYFRFFLFLSTLRIKLSFVARPALLVPGIANPVAWLQKKGPRGFRRRSKSREEMPREDPTAGSCRVACFANQKAPRIDGAQLLLTHYIFAWLMRRIRADRAGGSLLLVFLGLTAALFQQECAHDPDRLRNKATSCLRFISSSDGSYPEIEYN